MALFNMGSSLTAIKSQNKALTSQAQSMADSAITQVKSDLNVLGTRKTQVSDQITLEQVRRIRQGARERGTLQTRLADAGVAGGTTIRDTVASVIQEDIDLGTLDTKRDWAIQQIELEKRGAVARGQSEINKAQSLLGQRTSGTAGVLQLIGAGISGYSQGKQLTG